MSVMLATLVLNESEWLPKLYEQHRDWPGLVRWVFVEASDAAYAKANPDMVGPLGLSVDGTFNILHELAESDPRVIYIPYGRAEADDPAKAKCGPRDAYLRVAEALRPEFVISLDADEFYTRDHQASLLGWMRTFPLTKSFIFRRREIWRPPAVQSSALFVREVVGGFWNIPCCHWWRWEPGMHHRLCHNTPHTADDVPMNRDILDLRDETETPEMVHLGFASTERTRRAKNRYYAERGEAVDRHRAWYVESRAAWETWKPGVPLPRGAEVRDYGGPIPECFRA